MNAARNVVAVSAAALPAVSAPAGATTHEPAPPSARPGEAQWPPASTHGTSVPLPEE